MAEFARYTASVWQVKAGQEDTFVQEWTTNTQATLGLPGNGGALLLQDRMNPSRFISFQPWESDEAMAAMRQVPGFRDWVSRARELCDDYVASAYSVVRQLEPEA